MNRIVMTLAREDIDNCKDLGDSYLDIQKTRVGMELRLMQMENKHLVRVGLCEKTIVDETARGKKKSGIKYIRRNEPIEEQLKPLKRLLKKYEVLKKNSASTNELHDLAMNVPEEYQGITYIETFEMVEKRVAGLEKKRKNVNDEIKLSLNEIASRSQTFKLFNEIFKDLHKVESKVLTNAEDIFGDTQLWKWCENTRGLGPVAALTFLSNIDVFTSPTIGNVWSNFGLIPGKTLKRGESSNFNPHVRARILGVICNNIIRSGDYYYVGVYHIKKEYHRQRPDLIAKQDSEPKSWDMHMHRMAYRVLAKLLVSHAYQLIKTDLGVGTTEILHRNPIPIKPIDKIEQDKVLANYQMNHDAMLSKLKPLWNTYISAPEGLHDKALEAYELELKHPSKLI
jgi:hypothetical protein